MNNPYHLSYPTLLNTDVDIAVANLKKENPTYAICKVAKGQFVINDYDPGRIFVWYNPENNLVFQIPQTG